MVFANLHFDKLVVFTEFYIHAKIALGFKPLLVSSISFISFKRDEHLGFDFIGICIAWLICARILVQVSSLCVI